MFIQMKSRGDQRDAWEQREIIKLLSQTGDARLNVVVDTFGNYKSQDNTEAPLDLEFQVIDLYDKLIHRYTTKDIENDLMLPLAKTIFAMSGLVVVDCVLASKCLVGWFMEVLKEHYFQDVEANDKEKIHLIYL